MRLELPELKFLEALPKHPSALVSNPFFIDEDTGSVFARNSASKQR